MFIGQQYTQNVLGYSPVDAALITVPAAIGVMVAARPAGRLIARYGSRVPVGCRSRRHRPRLRRHGVRVRRQHLGVGRRHGLSRRWRRDRACRTPVLQLPHGFRARGTRRYGVRVERPPARLRRSALPSGDGHPLGSAVLQLLHPGVQHAPSSAGQPALEPSRRHDQPVVHGSRAGRRSSFHRLRRKQLVAAAKQAFLAGKTSAMLFAALAAAVGFVVVVLMYPNRRTNRRATTTSQPTNHRRLLPPPARHRLLGRADT